MKWQSQHFLILSYGDKLSFLDLIWSKKPGKWNFWTRSSSGWVLTYLRTFRMTIQTFFNLSYGPKLIVCLFVRTKPGKLNFWGEEFFGMSSYTCENFQPFILYNFQFHHIMLKRLPGRPKLHFRLFSVFIVVFYNFHSRFWPFS